ncbi:MAG: extracellular solute-binding protein [Oligoflexales bacterium]|nr:extracellular solute-binding protein [Oligoflexales bacterium]
MGIRIPFFFSFIICTKIFASLPYQGKTLKVLSFKDSHSQAVEKYLGDFEKRTGAKVIFDDIASSMVVTKIFTDQLAGGSYDVYTVDEPFIGPVSKLLTPLDQWPAPRLIEPKEVALNQFLPAAQSAATYESKSFGLPINGNVYLYQVRKDLIDDPGEKASFKKKYGYDLKVPQNVKEMEDIAAFFYRPPRLYGFAPFTKKSEGTTVEALWLLKTFAVEFFDSSGNLVFDEKKARDAFNFYLRMMQYAPKGAKSWHHAERMAVYSKGKVVQMLNWPSFAKTLEDPKRSKVVGKTTYTAPPKGPGGTASIAGVWFVGIAKTSSEKALASEFSSWWASKTAGKSLVAYGMNPARFDLLQDPDLRKKYLYFDGMLDSFKSARVRPHLPEYRKFSDMISHYFTSVIAHTMSVDEAVTGIRKKLGLYSKGSKIGMLSQ